MRHHIRGVFILIWGSLIACTHIKPQIVNEQAPKVNLWEQRLAVGSYSDAHWNYFGFYDRSGTFEHQYGGEYAGYFEYTFKAPPAPPASLTIRARLSAESHEKGKASEISDVTLLVNGVEMGTITVQPDDMLGKVYTWQSKEPRVMKKLSTSAQNTLRFEVKATAKNRHGICLYGDAIDGKSEGLPISISMQAR